MYSTWFDVKVCTNIISGLLVSLQHPMKGVEEGLYASHENSARKFIHVGRVGITQNNIIRPTVSNIRVIESLR